MTKRLERNNYVFGQFLGVDDFKREQQYFLDRLRRHNRFAHGWGVVAGLDVKIDGPEVLVGPGLAIDCEGNELELAEQQRVAIGTAAHALFVGIKYIETPSSPTPGLNGVCYATVIEEAQVELATHNACLGHARLGPGTPGCGRRHPVVLARIKPHKGGWQLRVTKCGA